MVLHLPYKKSAGQPVLCHGFGMKLAGQRGPALSPEADLAPFIPYVNEALLHSVLT